MTTGQYLRKVLGLGQLPEVRINRLEASAIKLLIVWYDSNRPTMPITTFRIKRDPFIVSVYKGYELNQGKRKKVFMTPLMDLDKYNGTLDNATVIAVDLSGSYKLNPRMYESGNDCPSYIINHLNEFVTIKDLQSTNVVSDFTKGFRKRRNKIMGTENTTAKPADVKIDRERNSVIFHFVVPATQDYPDDFQFKKVKKDFTIINNPIEIYDVYFEFLDFFDWLDALTTGQEEIKPKDLKELIDISNVRLWSTSPSYHWQGFNFWLSELEGSMYPTDIKPKKWDKFHGDGTAFLDKHTAGIIQQFAFFINPLASMLNLKLKKEGLI